MSASSTRFQLLWYTVEVDTSDPAVREILRCLENGCDQRVEPRFTMAYRVDARNGGYVVYEGADELANVGDPGAVLAAVYRRAYQRVHEYACVCGWVRVHAGLAILNDGRRVLLAAPSGGGKTTLLLRLLFDGIAVQGDEATLVRGGRALAVPRPFHLSMSTQSLLAELALAALLPRLANTDRLVFDPTVVGLNWSIDEGRVDEVVVLGRGDGTAGIEREESTAVMPELVRDAFPNGEPIETLLREIAGVLRAARCWRISGGTPAERSQLVRSLAWA